jgi:2'-hydroxyisoflavone reductase
MRLLVIGGGRFLGRATVQAALDAGHDVTTFTRGRSAIADGVRQIHGDRESLDDLAQLRGGEWDVVVDTCGYVPRVVRASARLLAGSVGHYVFVSSISVYSRWPEQPIRDDSPVYDCGPDAGPDDGHYGERKAGCERAVEDSFPGRATLVRAGMLVGPYDTSGRLVWWLRRVAEGGEVLAPGDPDQPLSLVDVRDLGPWMLHCGQSGLAGAYVATAPYAQTTLSELLQLCRSVTGSKARFTWLSDEFLLAQGVHGWVEVPLWLAKSEGAAAWDVDASAAQRAALKCRPLCQTVADTWEWIQRTGATHTPPAVTGLARSKENAVLVRWELRRR